jgi:hypothetical protein
MTNAGFCIKTKSTLGFFFLSRCKQLPQLTTNTGNGRFLGGLPLTTDVAIANNNGGGGFFCICTGSGTTKGGKGNKGEELHNYIDIDLLVSIDWFVME